MLALVVIIVLLTGIYFRHWISGSNRQTPGGKERFASSQLAADCNNKTLTNLHEYHGLDNLPVLSTVKEESAKEVLVVKARTHSDSVQATLRPDYKTETLTRFGSDLKFDQQSCPTDSIMTNSTLANSSPLHDDCPTLFIVGARKGGSTSLLKYISQHPEFKGALLDRGLHSGETMFFRKKFKNLAWEEYMSWFPTESGRRLMTGESSVAYLVDCLVPRRIFEYCGRQAKIVMLLRNPVDRFISNFQMRVRVRRIGKDRHLAEFIQHGLDVFLYGTNRKGSATTKQYLHHGWSSFRCKFPSAKNMIYEGIYYIHLMNWLCNFPAENIMIINSEEFFQNTHRILKQVFQFLGLRSLPDDETYKMSVAKVYNHGRYADVPPHQQLTKENRNKLRMVYKPFNEALFEMLNWTRGDIEWT